MLLSFPKRKALRNLLSAAAPLQFAETFVDRNLVS
jgi:hypothetical protein